MKPVAPPPAWSYWVRPDELLAGEYPGAATPEATRARLLTLADAGIRCFFDLTQPGELRAYEEELPRQIEYWRSPIRDHDIPQLKAQMAQILDRIQDAVRAQRPVYVHCHAGIGRTGTVAGCWLVEQGLTGDGALEELNRLWQQSARALKWARVQVPETREQAEYVRCWRPRPKP